MRYVIAVMLTASLGIGPAWALFETNKQLAESATITMDQAVKTAVSAVPGKAVEAQLGKEDGRTVYSSIDQIEQPEGSLCSPSAVHDAVDLEHLARITP